MSNKVKGLLVAAFVAVFGLAFGGAALAQLGDLPGMDAAGANTGGLEAPAVGELGNTEHGPCVEDLLDIPALGACRDAEGRVIMDLPALKLVSPAAPSALPATGMNTGDFAAVGTAVLAAGFVLLRRVRLALAS
ncbi:MAG: LPXTG cell wall anchor domain-containing protein [Actinomycetota bacterium]